MNILLWVLQVGVGFMTVMGAAWRMMNYEMAAKGFPSVRALSANAWNVIGGFEIACVLGFILPGLFSYINPRLAPLAAACLAVELLLVTALHARFSGFKFKKTNPGAYSFVLAVLSALIAYGRCSVSPF